MHKRIINPVPPDASSIDEDWLHLDHSAQVEITSEAADHPIESALLPSGAASGWRAALPGKQIIRILFNQPQQLKRIWLVFNEPAVERTQEFVLRWSGDGGRSYQEIVRQQWSFSPAGSTRETEDYRVELSGVTVLELVIVPEMSGGEAHASLAQMRLA